jgi:hypothetical protein
VIWHFPQVVRVAKLLTEVGKALDMPTLATEQYPKALGPTVRPGSRLGGDLCAHR